jgi:hypothetical protein
MTTLLALRPPRALMRVVVLSVLTVLAFAAGALPQGDRISPVGRTGSASVAPASVTPPAIIIGFVGGFIRHDNLVHAEVQLAARLRKAYPSGVDVETFENYHGENARKRILSLLDTNHDGTLTAAEKQRARIILYGHSWGGSEAVTVARALGNDGIPVLLTVQVDSVAKFRENDAVIPANVAQAVNFYQPHGVVHGRSAIRAADPARTRIIGNFKFDYATSAYTCKEYPWFDHYIVKPHTQIECDPKVWQQAEDLIRKELPAATQRAQEQ